MSRAELWLRWARVSFIDLARTSAEVLATFPAADSPYAGDYRRLLESLDAGEPIRINCGGTAYTAADGTMWMQDGFFAGGYRYGERAMPPLTRPFPRQVFDWEVLATKDDPLYQTHRAFPPDEAAALAYRVPLPPGHYRISLHFAEIEHGKSGKRRFDVAIEGRTVLSEHDPFDESGFATATVSAFTVAVSDGVLDLELTPSAGEPLLSALEIQALD